MKLYHSSNVAVPSPDVVHSRDNLDFGKGFYLTPFFDQAVSYAQRFKRRNQEAWINVYEFEFDSSDWKVREFELYDGQWLDFISKCRAGKDEFSYDMVLGGIADDKVIRTLDRYFQGELTDEQTLGLLKFEKPNMQYCIRSQAMLDTCLKHIESRQI
ncbi:MAG: DUF3990 domain-containing protein [Muribaculaceae bacterium]|nr:DUF3990 domain-containing protein [Muribaculaceae bacterium]